MSNRTRLQAEETIAFLREENRQIMNRNHELERLRVRLQDRCTEQVYEIRMLKDRLLTVEEGLRNWDVCPQCFLYADQGKCKNCRDKEKP